MLFVQHLMMHDVHYLNIFPLKYGVSTELSPETIMTGFPPPDYNKLKIEFVFYAKVFDAPSPSNTPQSCTHGAIALGATGNAGGAFYFLSLASGEILSWHQWTVCPIQEEVIKILEVFAIKDKQPIIQSTGLVVEWGQVILDTSPLDIPIDPIHRPDIVIDQNNHDLAVRVSENDSDANSVHENLDNTGFVDDDQESEVEQNIQVDDVDRPFENQGAAYEHEVVHEHDEPNVIQGEVHQDDEQITELNTVDVDTQIHESHHNSNQIPEPSTEDETKIRSETEGIVDVGAGLIEREQGAVYNLRNCHML